MDKFRAIVERTLTETKQRKECLMEQALQCHDRLVAAKQRDPSGLQPEIESLRQELLRLIHEIMQESYILALDKKDPHHERQRAWNSMEEENKWKKEIILILLFSHHEERFDLTYPWQLAPESIRNDSDVVLARLCVWSSSLALPQIALPDGRRVTSFVCFGVDQQNHPFHFVPEHFWGDKAFVLIALKLFPEALLTLVPVNLLGDPDVFWAFTEVEPRRRGAFLPSEDPWQDAQFRQLLSRFSLSIRTDPNLMLPLVQKCGLCLRYIDDDEFRRAHPEILRAACEENFFAFQYVDVNVVEMLLRDKAFVMSVFARYKFWNQRATQLLYRSLPELLQSDDDVLDLVLRHWFIIVDDLPGAVRQNREFWLRACQYMEDSLLTLEEIPAAYRDDDEFLQHIRFEDRDEVDQYLRAFPHRAGSRLFWTSVIKSDRISRNDLLPELIRDHAIPEIRQDRELMLLACQRESKVFELLHEDLQADRDILTAIVQDEYDTESFFLIPLPVQRLHPDLTLRAMEPVEGQWIKTEDIADELWTDVEVAKAFVEHRNSGMFIGGVPPLPPGFPESMKSNEDFGLFATEHCYKATDFEEFTSASLRSSKAFMMQAVERNPICLAAGVNGLAEDFDVAALAFSHREHSPEKLFGCHNAEENYDYKTELEFLHSIAAEARERVITFEGFTKAFLFGMIDRPGSSCKLPMLIRDNATTKGLKELIADFAGVPELEQVDRLRATSLHLLFACLDDRFAHLFFAA